MSTVRPPPGVKPKRTYPAGAFWAVVIVAIVAGVAAGLLWYFLQNLRNTEAADCASRCPTVIPQTCCPLNSSGNPMPNCTTACNTNADCPSYASTCNSGTCQ